MVWLEDWANRIPIEIDQTKIDEDLTDFPVLITLSGSAVFDALTVSSTVDSYDILFLDSRGDQSSVGTTIRYATNGATYGCYPQTVSGIKCIYADGSNDLLYCEDSADYNLGTVDFTIEAWVRPILLSSVNCIMGHGFIETQNGAWGFRFGTNGPWGTGVRLNFAIRSGGSVYEFTSNEITSYISINTWNHIALVRSAGTLFFYLNGIQRGSVSCNYDLTVVAASNLYLTYRYTGSGYTDLCFGYVTKWRLSKNTARYLSDFTPPTTYTNDSYTKFMYMAENDMSPLEQVLNEYGDVYVTRASTPFNRNASWDMVAGSDDYLRIDNNAAFDLGSNNFTIDGWAYIKSYDASYRYIISKRTAGSYTWLLLGVSNTGYFKAYMSNNNSAWQIEFVGSYVPVNTWFHFALVRNGTTVDLYYNGIKTNTGTFTGSLYNNASVLTYIGLGDNSGGGDWYGYIYGLRVSKGIARYSDNFTPGDPLEFNSSFSNRKKIAITDANNNQLYTEIERWDHANKKAWLWTKVPTVASGTNTKLYFYYDKNKSDNTNYIGDTTSIPAKQVWDSNFMAVWHLNSGFATTSYILDSTVSGNHITSVGGGVTSANIIPFKIGQGLDLERNSSQYCNVSSTVSLKGQTQASIEAIVNLESHNGSTSYYCAIYFEPTSTNGYTRLGLWTKGIDGVTTRFEAGYRDSANDPTGSLVAIADSYNLALSTNYYVATTFNSDTDNFKLFRDGLRVGISTASAAAFGSSTTYGINIGSNPNQYFDGLIDEIRISKRERSEAWIKATYYSNWNELLIYGAAESVPYFYYEGYINVLGAPAARKVHLYRRSTGQLVDGTTSSGTTGYFKLQSPFVEYHYVVVLPDVSEGYAILFDDKVNPGI